MKYSRRCDILLYNMYATYIHCEKMRSNYISNDLNRNTTLPREISILNNRSNSRCTKSVRKRKAIAFTSNN